MSATSDSFMDNQPNSGLIWGKAAVRWLLVRIGELGAQL